MNNARNYIIFGCLIVFMAAVLRFADLPRKALHHDESVNYAFTKKLADRFNYKYNPTAYHGPFLYFAGYPAYKILGPSKFGLRTTPALAGILAVVFILLMGNVIGRKGALAAAAVMALSPADVYYSRTFIHEIYLACFHAGLLWGLLEYARTQKGRYLFPIGIFLALCFTVKETTALMVVAMVVAYFSMRLFYYGMPRPDGSDEEMTISWAGLKTNKFLLMDSAGLAISIWVLFFTSFLTYPEGLARFFEAFTPWAKTGFKDKGHDKAFYYFFIVLGKYYAPIVIPALFAGIWALFRQKARGLFLFLYAMFTLMIYSAIPYKTPWCVLQIGLPFLLLGGYGLSKVWDPRISPKVLRLSVLVIFIAALIPYGWYSYQINFQRYDDDTNKIIYVQTDRTYEDMLDLIARMEKRSGLGKAIPIALIKAKNPARPYLHYYTNVKKYEEVPDSIKDRPVIIVETGKLDQTVALLENEYINLTYPVWPGTFVALLVEEKFYEKYAKEEK